MWARLATFQEASLRLEDEVTEQPVQNITDSYGRILGKSSTYQNKKNMSI
jgi:hypothetical protein